MIEIKACRRVEIAERHSLDNRLAVERLGLDHNPTAAGIFLCLRPTRRVRVVRVSCTRIVARHASRRASFYSPDALFAEFIASRFVVESDVVVGDDNLIETRPTHDAWIGELVVI